MHLPRIVYSLGSNTYQFMAPGWLLKSGRPGFDSRQKKKCLFLHPTAFIPGMRPTQPPIEWIPRAPSPEVKQPKCEADHSPPHRAEVKNCGAIPPLPHTSSRSGAESIIYGNNFTFLAYFPKVCLRGLLPVCVSVSPLSLLGNGSVNTFPRQRLHMQ
jgi:hypothetical protein